MNTMLYGIADFTLNTQEGSVRGTTTRSWLTQMTVAPHLGACSLGDTEVIDGEVYHDQIPK